MIVSHIVLFNLFILVGVAYEVYFWCSIEKKHSNLKALAIFFDIWMSCGLLVQTLIAKAIVMFSKPSGNASTNQIWQCVVDHPIGHIRNS